MDYTTNRITTIYFVRHAEPNISNHDDSLRELSSKGLEDRTLVTRFLSGKQIDVVLSSPYKRAVDTVLDFAQQNNLNVQTVDNFKERKIDHVWISDFNAFCEAQWNDFNYKLPGGESLAEVQYRNVTALQDVLRTYSGKRIVIGSHGTALSTIINYYDKSFGYLQYQKIKHLMPWIVQFTFTGEVCCSIQAYNLFES